MIEVLARHKKIAFAFSGGKDSMACLYLLREHLDQITVYHLNAGEETPETREIIEKCRGMIPHFVEVKSDSLAWRRANGDPSDVVPTSSTLLGRAYGLGTLAISDRFACCWANIMLPMHERIVADGNTLVIRGTKAADTPRMANKSGDADGIELYLPIQDWSDGQVMAYLREVGAPIHPAYAKLRGGVDCMTCTAWWDEKALDWLSEAHPVEAAIVREKRSQIQAAVLHQMSYYARIS